MVANFTYFTMLKFDFHRTIGRSGERGSGISVLPARDDDDDDDDERLFYAWRLISYIEHLYFDFFSCF